MRTLMFTVFILALLPAFAQHTPIIFDVSDAVVGAREIEDKYLYAMGKWSDAGEHVGTNSTQIHCYKRLGFCEVANAFSMGGDAMANLDSYDILRWDTAEIIAVAVLRSAS